MPAPPLSNTFESGQPDGTVISAGNSGGGAGTAFSVITGSPTYSVTHVKAGSLAMSVDTTGTYAETHVAWTGLGSFTTNVWFRTYMYLTANPVATQPRLLCARTSAAANSGFVTMTTAGLLQSMNAAQAGSGTGTVPVALNQYIRVEWRILSSTTVGESEWWLYNTPEAPIGSFDDHTNTTGMVLGANTDGIRYGAATATGPANFHFWMDDVAVSSTGQVGPSGGVIPGPGDDPPIGFIGRGAGW